MMHQAYTHAFALKRTYDTPNVHHMLQKLSYYVLFDNYLKNSKTVLHSS